MDEINRIWVDVETSGLDPEKDYLLEVGIVLTDRWGGSIAEDSWLLDTVLPKEVDPFVVEMHNKSGLWNDLTDSTATLTQIEATDRILDFLTIHNIRYSSLPMCGSSVHFDRSFLKKFLPEVEKHFHYRNIDISTLKLLCEDLNPELYAKLDSETQPAKKHRAISDCYDTINEYKFYWENFLFVGEEVA